MSRLHKNSLLLIFAACALVFAPSALAQVAGQNVNMVSGTSWPGGDPFLQRQNEPSMAVSTRNPLHILAGANDYRTVDLELALSGGAETGDSWLGLFKSFDGGLTWRSTLLPGCKYADPQCNDSGALHGIYDAGSDPVVRAGTNGMFYYAGLAFDRATSSTTASSVSTIFVARYNDLNNNENADPITYIDTRVVASGNGSQFLDKPAMAVDIPRSGANTCSFNANEPGVGPNGGSLSVHQSFAAGNVYITYTDFLAPTKANSTPTHLMFTRSTDCGVTWSTPVQINTGTTTSQGSAIAINALNGNVFVTWRQFASTGIPDAIMIAQSKDAGRTFGAPVRISTFTPFDQGTTGTSFRTNAYPSLTTDMFGFVYVAFSAKGLVASGDARVVAAGSTDGTHWTPAIMVDNPSTNVQTNPSGRGHQIMPAITFANGRLTLLYYDLRLDHYENVYTSAPKTPTGYTSTLTPEGELKSPATPAKVFTPFIDDLGLTLRRHTLDLRVLQLGIFPTVVLGPSVLVSQYAFGCCVNPNLPTVEQFKFNVPNLPIFSQGAVPFLGDYIDVVPSPAFVPNGSSWAYNFTPSVNPQFHATWTDNRDVVPPANGDWTHYTPPVPANTPSVFDTGATLPLCRTGQEGMRNQNIYTAQITGGLIAGAKGNSKPLGTTVFNGRTVPFQRAFAVEAQNVTSQPINVRFSIANQPPGGTASFLQFSLRTTLDITIPAFSSVSRSVFVTSTNAQAAVTVNVVQINSIGGSATTNGLSSSAVLNPDITNPNITNPNITNPNITNPNITNFEVTNPNITNPNITNPNITNPNITNPNITNPNITNPNITNPNITNVSATNPNITNPNITNPNITNPNITNPNITNPNITNGAIQDVIYPITNNGNTTSTYTVKVATSLTPPGGVLLQLILNKLYQTPVAIECQLTTETHWVTVANIVTPKLYAANDPQLGNPNITNSTPNEASVTLAPGETAYITLRVISPTKTPVNPLTYFTPVTIPQAVNTQTALANPGGIVPPVAVPALIITTATLPDNVLTSAYSATVGVQGGNPGTARTFSVSSGALPNGLTLNTATGTISGTPTVGGTFTFSIQAKDTAIGTQFPQHTTTQAFTIHVVSPVALTVGSAPPGGTQGTPYSATISPVGGQPPFTLSIISGAVPDGLTFNNGVITGTPTGTGTSNFTVKVVDSTNPPQTTTRAYSINIISSVPVPGNVTFVNQPLNSTGGQFLSGSPVTVQVFDNTHAVIPNANVIMSFNGTPPCSTAVLSGTLTRTTDATGTATFNDLSVDRGQLGYTLRATVVGTTVAGNSNAFTVNGFCGTGNLIVSRLGQTSTLLTNGTVLITGGQVDQGPAATNEAEIYNPTTGAFTATTGTMTTARLNHTATLLNDGRVLIAGGAGTGGGSLPSAETYDPTSGIFTATTGTLQSSRSSHTATLLADGTVLLAGGTNGDIENSAEVFNPTANTFALVGTMNLGRQFHTATLLANGGVLITGGIATSGITATAEIYDPVAKTFSSTGNMGTARQFHTATLLSSGKVLVAGGLQSNGATPIASAELFDPSLGSFAGTGSLNTARGIHNASLLTDGTVLVAGGYIGTSTALASSEIYSPTGGTFANTGTLMTGRYHHSATLLNDGTVLAAAGSGIGVFMNSAERYFSTSPLAPLVLTTPNVSILADRAASQFLLEQGGVGPLTWSLQSGIGSLPAGINFDNSKGLFTGATENTGSFPLIVTITDSSSPESKSVVTHPTLNVIAPLAITTTTLPNAPTQNGAPGGTSAVAYSAQVLTSGGAGGATTFSLISGALPPSMTLNTATGAITSNNVNDAASPTPYTFTIQAVSAGPPSSTATQALSITIVPLFFGNTSNNLQNGTVGSSYTPQNISAAGGIPPFTYSLISGGTGLPPGLSFSTLDSTTAQVTGTPTAAGNYNFFISVHDSSSPAQGFSQQFFITVAPAAPPSETLAFTTQPSNATTGQALPPFVVRVLLNGSPVPHAPVTVNFGNAACSSATLSGTTIVATDPTGYATFNNVFIDRGGRGYTLKATSTDPSAFATSTAFNAPGFCATGTMSGARYNHVAVKLPNGAVLVAGGNSSSGDSIATSETYAPDGGFVTNVNMQSARSSFTGTLLTAGPNAGKVLLVGGIVAASGTTTPSVELFDPTSATFTLGTSHMAVARFLHTATLVPNGDVLIAGGSSAFGSDVPTAEIYHAADGTFSAPINLASAHTNATATLLPNGKVLIAGGSKLISSTETSIANAELFDPSTNTFTATGSMNVARSQHVAVLLPNGKVLVAGGVNASNMAEGSAELYDPSLGTFSTTGSLAAGGNAAAALLSTGKVLVIGGGAPQTNVAQLYDPTSGSFTTIQPMVNARADFPAVVLNDGTVLAAGGFNTPSAIANAELYYPDAPAAMQVTSRSNPGPGTSVFSDATAFSGNINSSTPIGFNGIRPAGQDFAAFNPLVVSGVSFSASGANVNVTRSDLYSPNTYPADFIVDSANSNMTNQVTIVLPAATTALGIDYGGLGFSGASTGNITLSNGFVLPLASLPTVGRTQFSGFVSSTPFSSLTYTANNDSWVVTDLLLAAANPDRSMVTEGSSYTQILLQQGGVGPLVWTLGSGSLPTGITLSSSGILNGRPTAGGVFTFGVHVVDSSNPPRSADSGNLTINVVPQPPTNAAQGPTTSSSVGLIWEFSLSSDVVGYKVYRASASGGPYTELASLNSSAFSYTDSAVQQDHVYYYVVTAVGPASLESVNSNEVAASTSP